MYLYMYLYAIYNSTSLTLNIHIGIFLQPVYIYIVYTYVLCIYTIYNVRVLLLLLFLELHVTFCIIFLRRKMFFFYSHSFPNLFDRIFFNSKSQINLLFLIALKFREMGNVIFFSFSNIHRKKYVQNKIFYFSTLLFSSLF